MIMLGEWVLATDEKEGACCDAVLAYLAHGHILICKGNAAIFFVKNLETLSKGSQCILT